MFNGMPHVSFTNNRPLYPESVYPASETFSYPPHQAKVHTFTQTNPQFFPTALQVPYYQPTDLVLPQDRMGQEMMVSRNVLFQPAEDVTAFLQPLVGKEEKPPILVQKESKNPNVPVKRKFKEPAQTDNGIELPKAKKQKLNPRAEDRAIQHNNGTHELQFILPLQPKVAEEEQDITVDENLGPHFPLIDGDEIDLLPLVDLYQKIEGPEIKFQGKNVHFYPTETVRRIYKDFAIQQKANPHTSFGDFLNRHKLAKKLTIKRDTTLYYPDQWLVENKMAHIFENQIVRQTINEPLGLDKKQIFVVDAQGRMMIASKQLEGKYGRTQHSSLAQGNAVRVAGIMSRKEGGIYRFENLSGHYKPGRDALTEVARWITRQGCSYTVVKDEIYNHKDAGPTRLLELRIV